MIRRLLLGTVIAAAVLALALWLAWRWAEGRFAAPGPLTAEAAVLIPKGTGLKGIANRLSDAGAVADPRLFKVMVRLKRQAAALKAGEYLIPAQASMAVILERMQAGDVIHHRVTIPEGMTSAQAMSLIAKLPLLEGELTAVPAEGSLLPETYYYVYGDSRAELLGRMTDAMTGALMTAWAKRAPDLAVKTKEEAAILASIVEKETALPAERPRIAAVFLNRLKKGMKLQSDPTVVYALTKGEPLGRALLKDDLETLSPYNTYLNYGLPPGPIANPGLDAILAVVNPAESNELYFVADGSGGHVFSRTLDEHNRNVAKWRRIKRTLNISPLPRRDAQHSVEPGSGQNAQ